MPIWLRRFTFNSINDYYQQQNEKSSAAQGKNKISIDRPNIDPTYSSKASK